MRDIAFDYTDGDISILDNVRDLTEVRPMKPTMNTIILCTKGKAQLDINAETTTMLVGDVLITPPHVIVDNLLISTDFECKILCLSERIIQGLLHNNTDTWNRTVYINRKKIHPLSDDDRLLFEHYHTLIRSKMTDNGRSFQKEIMQSVMRALVLELCGILESDEQSSDTRMPESSSKQIFSRFLALLSKQDIKRKPVGHYAYELNITPKYLTMICERQSGKPASTWIEQYTLEDIRYHLRNTDLSIKEIADRLGFPTISFFGSYVRKHFGVSPKEYRAGTQKA